MSGEMTEEDVRAEPRRVAVRGEALRLKQLVEAFDSEASLTDQSAEGTGVKLTMVRHRERLREVGLRHDDVATALAPDLEACSLEGGNGLLPRYSG